MNTKRLLPLLNEYIQKYGNEYETNDVYFHDSYEEYCFLIDKQEMLCIYKAKRYKWRYEYTNIVGYVINDNDDLVIIASFRSLDKNDHMHIYSKL